MPRKESRDLPLGNWLLTFSCLMIQLLVFFVMFFALSEAATTDQLKRIKKEIDEYAERNLIKSFVKTDIKIKGLKITLADTLMFETAKAELKSEQAKEIINGIFDILNKYPNRIAIEGHTDIRPINTKEFPSNWELSNARALNILKSVIDRMNNPSRLTAAGYGENRPDTENFTNNIPPNYKGKIEEYVDLLSPEERTRLGNENDEEMARNRRVDIVVARLELWELKKWKDELVAKTREAFR